MTKEYHRKDVADRSGWPKGPWDSEPDFYEWTTAVGYEAYMFRLNSGAWAASITAPHPSGQMLLAFTHHMRDMYPDDHQAGMISKTDVEGIGDFCLSMEHYASPGPAYDGRDWNRGPYKTLDEVIQITEQVATHIYETHQEGIYTTYFER
jgi:hypothetical protein